LKRSFCILAILLFLLGGAYKSPSQVTFTGGKGLGRVLSADPVKPTDIFLSGNVSTYQVQTGPATLSKYYLSNLNTTVGLASYLETYFNIIPFQDNQKNLWGQFGDIHLGVKYLTPLATNFFKFGLSGYYKFPTAAIGNVAYETFSTDHPAWAARALLTLDFFDMMPTFPIKFNFNLGYIDHNIFDTYFTSNIDQMFVGAGVQFAIRSFQFFTEYSGEIFFNNSHNVPYNQNSHRLTQGIRFMGPWNNTIDLSFDFGLTQYDSLKNQDIFHKEYYSWKARVGITHRFSVYKYFDKSAKLQRMKEEEERRKLEEIRKKREKVKQELEQMKKRIEKKDDKKK